MIDREIVIEGLEYCTDIFKKCEDGCPYYNKTDFSECNILKKDALALLKQEAVEPKKEDDGNPEPCTAWWYVCGDCGQPIDKMDRYCRRCGKQVKWG